MEYGDSEEIKVKERIRRQIGEADQATLSERLLATLSAQLRYRSVIAIENSY